MDDEIQQFLFEFKLMNGIRVHPDRIVQVENGNYNLSLRSLNLSDLTLPTTLNNKIGELDLGRNNLRSLPPEIGNLINLERLALWNNQLRSLPAEIGDLGKLKHLNVHSNNLCSLPAEIGNLANLEKLLLHDNPLQSLPLEI